MSNKVNLTDKECDNPEFIRIKPRFIAKFPDKSYACGRVFSDFQQAYAFGWISRGSSQEWMGQIEIENELRARWEHFNHNKEMSFDEAKEAIRDGWNMNEQKADV